MIYTEGDAAGIWCPYTGGGPQHGDPLRQGKTGCFGAKCAGWRWHDRTRGLGYCGMAALLPEMPDRPRIDPLAPVPDPVAPITPREPSLKFGTLTRKRR